jgi:hypothetical protein
MMNMRSKRNLLDAPTAVLVLAALAASMFLLGAPARAPAQTFPDIGNQPAEIQQAIDYVTGKGYMNGGADGNFRPSDPVTRLDYACSLVRMFGVAGEPVDPSITFTDLSKSDPNYRYANIAVKKGYIEWFADRSFKPSLGHWTAPALAGLVKGLGMSEQAQNARGIWPGSPAASGTSIVAHDLHLKYRNTRAWPSAGYPRGELAFSLQATEQLDGWRKDYVVETFTRDRCQSPILGPLRKKAMDLAFSKIGYPYVWGGDCDEEGGYDCSGLTYFVLQRSMGYPMMRTADDQAKDGRYRTLSKDQLLAGDPIFFYKDPGQSDYVGHAGMYIGGGFFIHSTGGNAGVSVESISSGYYSDNFACGKRVIGEGEPGSFDTFFLLANPGDTPARARVTYMLKDSRQVPVEVSLEPRSRKTVRMDDTLVDEEASTTVEALTGQIVAERSMYFVYKDRIGGGHCSAGATEPSRTWFLAEGCTAYQFDTYVLVQNPGTEAADVRMTFLLQGGTTRETRFTVPPLARYTVVVDQVPGMESAEFSTQVDAAKPVVVERSMYFDYNGIKEGHSSGGVTSLSPEWYFAEGFTAGSFDTYILIANPQPATAHATLSLQSDDGKRGDVYLTLKPRSRMTVAVDKIKGWEQKAFSARVKADSPVAAERAMYFNYNGLTGGHDAFGVPAASQTWFIAEGYTAGDFDTYVLVSNPNREAAEVTARFLLPGGRSIDRSYRVAPQSRYTIAVDKVPGLEATEVSTAISSNLPVVVEGSEYFSYLGRAGGSSEHGVIAPAQKWYFAEGYTGR